MTSYIPNLSTSDSKNGIHVSSNANRTFKLLKRIIVCLLLLVVGIGNMFATPYYQRQSGYWNNPLTWTTSPGWQASDNTGTYPQAGDDVHLYNNGNTATITLTADAACTNLFFDNSCTASVIAMGNYNLTVSGSWTSDEGNGGTITQGSGYLQVNGGMPLFHIAKTIANLKVGSSSFNFVQYNNTTTLTVTSNYDYNCFQSTVPAGINASSAKKYNATPCNPILSTTALTSFRNVCISSTAGPNSFTINGLSLTNANITVAALPGFTYSTSSGGTYTNTLSLTQSGGPYSQVIYVMFNPVAEISYNGNIVVGGGGASNINVPAAGSGVSSVAPTVSSPTSTNILSTSATLGGNITVAGCSSQSITERGVFYSTTNGFADGTGTKVSETGTFGTGVFTENVTGLSPSTIYYYKAYATNSGGTGYSPQGTFNNTPLTYYSMQSGNWTSPSTWSTAGCGGTTNSGTYPGPGDNVVICQQHNITVDAAGLSCNTLNMSAYLTQLILNNDFTINGTLTLSQQSSISVGTNNLTITSNYSFDGSYNSNISWTNGNVIFGGNVSFSYGGSGTVGLNCTGTGWLIMNGTSKTFTVNNDIIVPRFRIGTSTITKAGSAKLTISSSFDLNNQTSFNQSAGIIDITGTVANYSSVAMAYSGTPTFSYSGGGKIVGGSYYNLTTQTTNISIDCGTTVTCAGTFTNSTSITGPTTTGYYARVVNTNPVTNSGTIGASSSYIAFSSTINGGTVGTNVKTNSSQAADCSSVFYSRASGNWNDNNTWSYTSGGPAVGSGVYPLGGDAVNIETGNAVTVNISNAACNQLTISNNNNNTTSSLTINTNTKLSIVGAFAFNGGNGNRYATLVNNGTIEFGSTVLFGTSNTSYTIGSNCTFAYNGNTDQTVQTIPGKNYNNLTLSGGGAKTTTGITVNGVLSMEGNATTTGTVATYGTAATLQYKGSAIQTTGVEFPSTFNGTGGVIINNASGVILGANRIIGTTSILTLTNGIITTTSGKLLSINNTSPSAISGQSTTSFINGPVNWTLPVSLSSGTTYNFPVGAGSTYLPFALVNPTTGTGTVTAQVQATAAGTGGTYDTTLSSLSTSEYWSLVTTGNFTTSSVSLTRQTAITPLSAIGSCTTLNGQYSFLGGTAGINGVSNSNSTTGPARYFVLATPTALVPTINVSASTLSGFTYPAGSGPSAQQSFTVSGTLLTTNITVLPTDSFDISLASGTSFAPQSKITLLVNNGTVALDTIYVRMKAGLAIGTIAPNAIKCSSDNVATKTVICSGSITNAPVITVNPTSLTGFNYNVSSGGPSTAQTFTVSGTNLTNNIILTAPTDYEISSTSGTTGYNPTLALSQTGGTVGITTIWIRLKAGLTGNIYNEALTASVATSTITATQNLSLKGSVNQPTINVSIFNLGGFIYTSGYGPSGAQSFTVGGQYLTTDIVLTAPASFEICQTLGGTYSSTITLTQSGGKVATTTIYARLKTALGIATYGPSNLTATSTGATPAASAIQQNVILSGAVVSGATSISSNNTLVGFVYTLGNGPSVVQSFTVSGTSLTSDITVTAPSNFEISQDCSTWATTFNITPASGLVNAVPVYIRLKAGLTVGTYTGTNITLASTGATTQNVACSGIVIAAPTITAGPSNLGSICSNTSVTLTASGADVSNYVWTGPNGYYSTTQNSVLGVVTSANNGTYTVTGSALSGVNLLTNGDFSAGITGFGSSYIYTPGYSTNQSIYNVGPSPHVMNNDFCTCGDKTTGTGNQMFVDGATSAGIIAWSESVSVVPGADYQFSFWAQTISAAGNPAQLQLYANGVPVGNVNTAPDWGSPWRQYVCNINSGSNAVLQLTLINKNLIAGGNDFALDDMMFQQAFPVSSSVTLTVNPTLPVSVGITASIDPLYSGGSVTFTATPVNGGTSPSYQWKVNGSNVGTSTPTYTYTPSGGDSIRCVLTSNYPCTTGNPASSTKLIATVRTNFWVGTTSTDWGTVTNWSGGFIPAPGNDVEYATTSNNKGNPAVRDLQLDQNRTIGSLVNATNNKRLIIPAGLGLIVNNTISTNNADSLIYIQSDLTKANGSLIFHNSSSSPVHGTVEMYSKAFYDPNGAVNQKYHWQYFGIPVSSVAANPTFYGSYVRGWNEAGTSISNHWVSLTNDSVLRPFNGYEITQQNPATIVFQGALVNSDFNPLPLSVTSTALYPGQHIYANPYTAAIDIRQLIFGSDTEATVYLYNTGTYNQWQLDSIANTTTGTNAGQYTAIPKNTAGNNNLPRQIPSMQGFLVKVMTPTSTSNSTFGIPYSSVAMNNTDPQRAPGIINPSSNDDVSTLIDLKGTNYGDRMWLFTQAGCTRNFDNGWDGAKISGDALTPQLFAIEPDGNYQVNAVDDINNTQLGFQAGQDKDYTLTFTHQNLKNRYAAMYLYDINENKTVDITESGSTYSFMAESAPTAQKRFIIVTRNIENDSTGTGSQLKVFTSGNTVFVQNSGNLNGEMALYDMMGHYLNKSPFAPYGITAINVGAITGAYIVKATTPNEKVSEKIIISK